MRILKIDRKENFLHLIPEIEDDLWHLERVIEKHDLITGLTDRKIKAKEQGEKAERIKLVVTLDVEKVEFHRFLGVLRVSGRIVDGKPADLVEFGAQQALELPLGKEVKIKKRSIKEYQVERLKRASAETKKGRIMLVVMDDEQALVANLREFGLEELASIKSGRSGKQFKSEDRQEKYFREILEKVLQGSPEKAIVAGPGFAKEGFQKLVESQGKGKTQFFFVAINGTGKTGMQELLKGNALGKAIEEMQVVKETRLVEAVLAELGKGAGLAEYGLKEVSKAIGFGAVEKLLVSDRFLLENREKAEEAMELAEKSGGEAHLINSEHEAGRQLSNLGGIAALLRFRIQ